MKRTMASWTLMALVSLWTGTAAAQASVVEAVQYPAWLERGARAVALTPGTVLQAQDRLRTGGNARVRLRLSEGSAVKLGENAQFVVERIEDRGAFRAGLAVLAGAFRFTTQALQLPRARDVSIRVKNVTVGIRGTDLWGKSTDERDLVCLLEGRISVGAAGHPAVTLDRPLDFYQKPREGPPQVAQVDLAQMEAWARETEIAGDGSTARGPWRVVAAVAANRDSALVLARRMRSAGFPAEIAPADDLFALQLSNLASEEHAREVMGNLRAVPGITLPKVVPMR